MWDCHHLGGWGEGIPERMFKKLYPWSELAQSTHEWNPDATRNNWRTYFPPIELKVLMHIVRCKSNTTAAAEERERARERETAFSQIGTGWPVRFAQIIQAKIWMSRIGQLVSSFIHMGGDSQSEQVMFWESVSMVTEFQLITQGFPHLSINLPWVSTYPTLWNTPTSVKYTDCSTGKHCESKIKSINFSNQTCGPEVWQ